MGSRGPKARPLRARLAERVERRDGCLVWTGTRELKGYGAIGVPGRGMLRVHRLAWELKHGPIPKGLAVHHICRNKLCVRTKHMELLTTSEHMKLHHAAGEASVITPEAAAKGRANRWPQPLHEIREGE